jgi:hypothetical protein
MEGGGEGPAGAADTQATAAGAATGASKANKGGRPAAAVNLHFNKASDVPINKRYDWSCKYCVTTLTNARKEELEDHILLCDGASESVKAQVRAARAEAVPDLPDGSSMPSRKGLKTRPITSFMASAEPFARTQQSDFDYLLLKALIDGGVPFRFVNNPFFLSWVDQISGQRYTPAGASTLC